MKLSSWLQRDKIVSNLEKFQDIIVISLWRKDILPIFHLVFHLDYLVDFKNTIIIMTSNIGSQYILDLAGDDSKYAQMRDRVMSAMRDYFRPQFLNRIDDLIIFHSLKPEQLREIVKIQVQLLERRLQDKKMSLKLSDAALDWLAEVGYDPVYGARPLKRAIQKEMETPIAKQILRGELKDGDTIFVDVKNERLVFKRLPELIKN